MVDYFFTKKEEAVSIANIRNAEIVDIDAIRELFQQYVQERNMDDFSEEDFDRSFAHLIKDKRDHFLVADVDGKLAGFCVITFSFKAHLANYGALVEDIYIEPEFRRMGIAQQLLNKALEQADASACSRLRAIFKSSDESGIQMLEKMGFIKQDVVVYNKSFDNA